MRPERTAISLFLLVLLFCTSLSAETNEGWYQIDIVAFKQRLLTGEDERWPVQPMSYPVDMLAISPGKYQPLNPAQRQYLEDARYYKPVPWTEDERSILMPFSASATDDIAGVQGTVDPRIIDKLLERPSALSFAELPGSRSSLNQVAGSIRRSSKYDLLARYSWVQPISGAPTTILLQAGEKFADVNELDGTIEIYVSRYLHVTTDLWFSRMALMYSEPAVPPDAASEQPSAAVKPAVAVPPQRRRLTHQLAHSRRMRSNELHFIDHPYFGLIVKILPFRRNSETL